MKFDSPALRIFQFRKITKLNIILLVGLLTISTFAVSFANPETNVTIGIQNTLWAYATDTNGNLLSVKINATTYRTHDGPAVPGSVKTTNTNRDFPFAASWHFRSSQRWKASMRVVAPPSGYESSGVVCAQTDFNNKNPRVLAQVEGTASKGNIATVDNLNPGGTTYCQFIFKKININRATLTSSVSPNVSFAGQDVIYTVTVRNTGTTTLANTPVTLYPQNRTVIVPGPIAPGGSRSAAIKYRLIPSDFLQKDKGKFISVACITGSATSCHSSVVTEARYIIGK